MKLFILQHNREKVPCFFILTSRLTRQLPHPAVVQASTLTSYHSGANSLLPNLVTCKWVLYSSHPFVLTTMGSYGLIFFFFHFFIVNRLGMDFEFHTHIHKSLIAICNCAWLTNIIRSSLKPLKPKGKRKRGRKKGNRDEKSL